MLGDQRDSADHAPRSHVTLLGLSMVTVFLEQHVAGQMRLTAFSVVPFTCMSIYILYPKDHLQDDINYSTEHWFRQLGGLLKCIITES